jgi:hypothetical protein
MAYSAQIECFELSCYRRLSDTGNTSVANSDALPLQPL